MGRDLLRSGTASATTLAPILDPALHAIGRAWVVGRVLAPLHRAPLRIATLRVQVRTAAGAAAFLGEERLEW